MLTLKRPTFLNPKFVLAEVGFPRGSTLADFGAGAGDFVLELAKITGPDGMVYAIDIQDSALSSVRSKARIEGMLNVNAIKANLEIIGASKLPDASCDGVLLSNILFQSEKKEGIITEAFRVLKDGGTLVFVDWRKDAVFGPARGWRLDRIPAKELIEGRGFSFVKDLDAAGAYHFGMVFIKHTSRA